jgi:DNA-binding response OmpR family regulator
MEWMEVDMTAAELMRALFPARHLAARTRILVVDDEAIVHAAVKKILCRPGYEVEAVYSAREGLERLAHETFDLAIVDLTMPEMNGIRFLEELGNGERRGGPPVLMVTGYPTIGTAVQALRLGAIDYVARPFTGKELLGPVQRALSAREAEGESHTDDPRLQIGRDDLLPGVLVVLPRHAWAEFQPDGTFRIGVEDSFLGAVDRIVSAAAFGEREMVEQGHIGIHLKNESGEEHGVAMPLTGQVVAVNQEPLDYPGRITTEEWLLQVAPSRLGEELEGLILRT